VKATSIVPEKLLLTPRETAAALSVSERTLATWTRAGTIPAVRVPGSRLVRYSPDAIRERINELQGPANMNGAGPRSQGG
jgi:excisionase family DNA binding protein